MHRVGFFASVLVGFALLAALPALPATAGVDKTGHPQLDNLLVGDLGLDPDQISRWNDGLVRVGDDWSAFGWGGDASVPATIGADDAPWTVPLTIGLSFVQWQDPGRLPDFGEGFQANGVVTGTVGGGPRAGLVYAVMTIVMADDIPLGTDMELFQQWDFVLDIPGLDRWEAPPQFPDDTWNQGSFVSSLSYGPNPWSLNFYSFPGGDIAREELPGFALVSGNTIIMGVEAVSDIFGPIGNGAALDIRGRLALDVKDAPVNPESSRVVTAPAVPLTENSFFDYLGGGSLIVPGLPGIFDIVDVWPIVGPDGLLWFDVMTAEPWGPEPPGQYFSNYIQVGVVPAGGVGQPTYFGFQTHAGESEVFGSGPDGEITGLPGYILEDGSVLLGTMLSYDGAGSLEVLADAGFLPEEDGVFQHNSRRFAFGPADFMMEDDPTLHDGSFPVYDLASGGTVAPPPEATTTTSTTTTTTLATTVTATPEAGDGGIPWLVIVGLIALGLVLLWLLWNWYANQRSATEEGKDIYRYGPTRERGRPSGAGGGEDDDDEPRDTPLPMVYGEELEDAACAWGLYFHDGSREIAIREPEIHEHLCCKYVVRVTTDVIDHAQAARGRQDAGAERLRIPDFDYGWRWVDLVGNASTRSGPAGRLDWVQGLGDPTDQANLSLDPYWQEGPEPPEVAAHLSHRERTDVDITLEAGCPEYKNLYSVSAASRLDLLATHECTNDAGDPCPVELNAFGFFGGWIIGPGNIFSGASDWTGSDPDELERSPLAKERIRAGGTPHTPSDAHDHAEKDRVAYEVSESDAASDALERDDLSVSIENDVELDAGQVVPVAVYPTTERVSTHIEGDLKHDLQIQVNLTPIDCELNDCGGHGRCNCQAEWTMRISGAGGSWIDGGDGPFEILREPTAADRRAPFTGERSWKGKT